MICHAFFSGRDMRRQKIPPFRQWGNSVRKIALFNREGDEFNNVFLNVERVSGRNTVTALVAVGIYKALFRDMGGVKAVYAVFVGVGDSLKNEYSVGDINLSVLV